MVNRLVCLDPDRRYILRRREFWRDFAKHVAANDLAGEAAKLSFFVILASLPFLLLVFTVVSLLPTEGMERVLVDALARLVPRQAVPILKLHLINTLSVDAGIAVWWGALGSLLLAARAIAVFETNINTARGTDDSRSTFRQYAERILIAAFLGLLLSVAPTILMSGWRVTAFIIEVTGFDLISLALWQTFRYGSVLLLVSAAASLLYSLGTANDRPWRWLTPGSILATLGWLAGSLTFKMLLARFQDYNVIYGSLGSIFSAMGWIYMSCLFFLSGAHLDGFVDRSLYPLMETVPAGAGDI